ncbi:PhzF family phenazine biosynthesis protein [Granulicella cerasi]|uniref:PhzF family phenazine biosynthesis protein n=1 Tax=Granulicella cerasi TaxID=741063 RepID=A0ABW1Z8H0_9BACT|nr:PhzF family phenazine biosynthesis protein [Granulicella cerasi]
MSTPRTLEYTVLDVFAEAPLAGNPLAVFHDARGLSTEEMQSLARETNLSETTFVLPSDDESQGVRVRIFTTEEELPFAGHPTLGTATWLHLNHPTLRGAEEIKLHLNVGTIPVRFTQREGAGYFGTMRQNDPVFGARFDAAEVASVIGVPEAAIDARYAPQSVSTGNAFCVVLLRDTEAFTNLAIDQRASAVWLRERGIRWFYVLLATEDPLRFRARMQFNGTEDPATGSAAGPAISWLVAQGIVPPDVEVVFEQGVEMLRPSRLYVQASKCEQGVHEVKVSGRTIPVAMGRYFLP